MKKKNHQRAIALLGTAFILLFCLPTMVCGQSGIGLKTNSVKPDGSRLELDFDIVFSDYPISPDQQIVLTPIISDAKGNSMELPDVIVNGSRRDNLYRRMEVLNNQQTPFVYTAVRVDEKAYTGLINYTTTIVREGWMNGATLHLQADLCGCGMEYERLADVKAVRLLQLEEPQFAYTYTPNIHFIAPKPEPIKQRMDVGSAFIVFPVNKSTIIPQLENNREELDKINKSLLAVRDQNGIIITAMHIEAYASPEGTWESNLRLSEQRANALKTYIQSNYRVPTGVMHSVGKGENWEGLEKMVEADNTIESKAEVLRIIREVDIFKGRELQLMNLAGGRPYCYMLTNIFPQLRRTDYRIEYTVPAFSIEKGKEILKTKPELLSLDELFRIAETYPKGSAEFNELFQLAARLYPADVTANLNAAAAALSKNETDTAEKILMQFASDPLSWNNLGVLRMKQWKFDEAEAHLKQAQSRGVAEATANLVILRELKNEVEQYNEARRVYEEYM